ncbi:MAG TPA: RNA 2',3'-cyclic phosphodiesterase [Candidatus Pacearchaeota archaeon]|jgi:2'-5' RNA ligase|nr:RNA 2',3'-cyclic phosphodiesterase [Candidatus Pacearchaeota archaeon]
MKKKIFIAINLPEKIKSELVSYQEKIDRFFDDTCPIKWTKKDNLHITMFFIGFVEYDELINVINKTEKALEDLEPFKIKIDSITYGPLGKTPKMVWANGEKIPSIVEANRKLEESLFEIRPTEHEFTPHITLGRIIQWQFKRIDEDQIPQIEEYPNLSFNVNSIDIMESVKGRYVILKSINL